MGLGWVGAGVGATDERNRECYDAGLMPPASNETQTATQTDTVMQTLMRKLLCVCVAMYAGYTVDIRVCKLTASENLLSRKCKNCKLN